MEIKSVNQQNNAVNFIVEVDQISWQEKVKKYFNQIAKNIRIEGFRLGKAPLNLVEKRINKSEVYQKAINESINQVLPKLEESKEFGSIIVELLERPKVDVKEFDDNKLVLNFTYEAMPFVDLKPYDNLDLDWSDRQIVKKEEIQKDLERIRDWNKKHVDVKDRPLQKDDLANIDFVGSIDGKEFAGGKAENYVLKIGSKQFIDNFEDQLIGMNIGETKTISVKFPKKYHNNNFANKQAEFKVALNSIQIEEQSKLDDEFAKSLKFGNFATLSDLEKYIEKQLQQKNDSVFKDKHQKDILLKIVELVETSYIPEGLLNDEIIRIENIFMNELKKQNLTLDKYIKENNLDKEKVKEVIKNDAINSIKYAFAIEKISKNENLEISDEEYRDYLQKVAQLYNLPFERVEAQFKQNEDLIRQDLLNSKILDHIITVNSKNADNFKIKKTTTKSKESTPKTSSNQPKTTKSKATKSK